jgi:multidrug efflux pump subunit AcrB
LAQHLHHRRVHTAVHPDFHHRAVLGGRDAQHHDPGRLALAVGILVDDATVTIENIERHMHLGSDLHKAILDGAGEIAVPALVSTLCICIVFVPMFFLTGVARYLFAPLAEAVVFAMLASYVLSRTLVPTW